jgi:hypothetical protein
MPAQQAGVSSTETTMLGYVARRTSTKAGEKQGVESELREQDGSASGMTEQDGTALDVLPVDLPPGAWLAAVIASAFWVRMPRHLSPASSVCGVPVREMRPLRRASPACRMGQGWTLARWHVDTPGSEQPLRRAGYRNWRRTSQP